MQHHIYPVWDFMSLIKSLQAEVAPARVPWAPADDTEVRRFINEIVLEEESDLAPPNADGHRAAISHFELYCVAMQEVGADPAPAQAFVNAVQHDGVQAAMRTCRVPPVAQDFMRTTFAFIDSGKPHVVAAAMALGREHIIPSMFRALLARIGIGASDAPVFHYYLNRHVDLDGDFHAPLSLRLLNALCGDDALRRDEAIAAARQAVTARLRFWDGVLAELNRAAA
jgi:hypothetical protein